MKRSFEIDKIFEIIEYFDDDREKAKKFMLLQKNVRYFLFMRKIKILNRLSIFDNVYIETPKCRPLIESKNTLDKYMSAPIIKYHMPITKIIMIQYNFKKHLKYMEKFPSYNINKISLNKCPLITKVTLIRINNDEDIYKNMKNKVINKEISLFSKRYYRYTPLLLIQRKYKERFKYLKENYKLKKHSKIIRIVVNKHHYIYHARVIDAMEQICLIQKNIKYFLYRKHSLINLIPKRRKEKCQIDRSFGFRELIIKYFYEEFITRIFNIITQYFLSFYFNIMKKNYILNKTDDKKNVIVDNNPAVQKKRNSFKTETNIHYINKVKALKRKQTFNVPLPKPNPVINKPRQSNLLVPKEESIQTKEKEKSSKKKVSFKNDSKINIPITRKDSKIVRSSFSSSSDIKSKKTMKSNNNALKRKQTIGAIRISPTYK